MRVEGWKVRGEGRGGKGEGGGTTVAKCGLRVEGYSRMSREEIARWGSEPELRHASSQSCAGGVSGIEFAGLAVRTHPNKKAPSPFDRKKSDEITARGCPLKNPVQVEVGRLPKR